MYIYMSACGRLHVQSSKARYLKRAVQGARSSCALRVRRTLQPLLCVPRRVKCGDLLVLTCPTHQEDLDFMAWGASIHQVQV